MNIRPLGWIAAASIALFAVQPVVAQATPTVAPIIGGNLASITDVPWQVGILGAPADDSDLDNPYGSAWGNQFCGGSIISEDWVVTAAHCVVDENGGVVQPPLWVFAGSADLYDFSGDHEYLVDEILVHPQYGGGSGYDIALLHVADTLPLDGTTMAAIALPIAEDGDFWPNYGDEVLVSGWGDTGAEYPTDLYSTTLDVLAEPHYEVCGDYQDYEWNPATEICVGIDGGGQDTCQGDSGGPYAINVNGTWTLAGVTSWGEGCALAGYPGFATRVTAMLPWIAEQVGSRLSNVTWSNGGGGNYTVGWTMTDGETFLNTGGEPHDVLIEYTLDGGVTWLPAGVDGRYSSSPATVNVVGANPVFRVQVVYPFPDGGFATNFHLRGDGLVPTSPTATVSGRNVTVRWTAPARFSFLEPYAYTVTASPSGQECMQFYTDTNSCVFTQLPLGVAQTFKVVANSDQGLTQSSAATSAVTVRTVPSAPRFLQVRSATSRSVWLQWSVPASTGGATVTDYRVYYKTATGAWRRVTGDPVSTSRSYTFTRPSRAKLWFKVVAVNSVGVSVASTTVSTPAR